MKAGWKIIPMGQLCSISSGESDTQDAVEDGQYAFFDRSKTIKRSSRFLYDCEALIIPGEGKEFLPRHFKGKFDLHQRAYALFDFNSELDVRFLYYLLHHRSDYLPSVAVGATVKSLRRRHFEELPVPLPPLAEQKRIVALLDEAFAGIDEAKAKAEVNITHAGSDLFETILESAMNGKLTEKWRNEHPKGELASALLDKILQKRRSNWAGNGPYQTPLEPDTGSLPASPAQWTYATIEQLLRDDGALSYGILKPGIPDPKGVPMVRVMDIGNGMVNNTDLMMVSKQLSDEYKRTTLEEDDIMLAVMATIGRCAIVPPHLVGANVNRALAVLKLSKLLHAQFILFAILSPRIQNLFQMNKMGAAQARINLGDLRGYAIPLPPIAEQRVIIEKLKSLLSETRRLNDLYGQKMCALMELKQSLLNQAFAGELTA